MTSITIHVQIMKQKEGCFYLPFFSRFERYVYLRWRETTLYKPFKVFIFRERFSQDCPLSYLSSILFTCYLFIFLISLFQIDLLKTKRSFHGIHGNATHNTWRNTRRLKTSSKSLACLPIMIKQLQLKQLEATSTSLLISRITLLSLN